MSTTSRGKRHGKGGRAHQPKRSQRQGKEKTQGGDGRFAMRFTDTGMAVVAEIRAMFRNRPMYYMLDEQGEPVPMGRSYVLTAEEHAKWEAWFRPEGPRTLEETVITHPEYPGRPIVVSTAFMGQDISYAFPLPNGAPALWKTSVLDKTDAQRRAGLENEADEEEDWDPDGEIVDPPQLVSLASKLGMDTDAFDDWILVYATREEALKGHAERVQLIRKTLRTL